MHGRIHITNLLGRALAATTGGGAYNVWASVDKIMDIQRYVVYCGVRFEELVEEEVELERAAARWNRVNKMLCESAVY